MRTAVSLEDVEGLKADDIFDLEGAYTTSLTMLRRDDSRQGYFHPSGVGMCRRKQVYEFIRTPFIETTDPDSTEIFDLGHAIHALVGTKLGAVSAVLAPRNIGYSLSLEVPFDPNTDELFADLAIGGTTDAVLDIWTDEWHQRSTIEIKSINREGFEALKRPKLEHLMQAHLYAFRWKTPIVYVWYYCKDTSKRRVYAVPFTRSVFVQAITYFEELHVHVQRGTLPERDESFYMCPRCEYRETCKPKALTQLRSKEDANVISNLRKRGRL
jgi:CRISPR/Cas system-associated exonuclease Cas4 (RecB family)